MFERPNRTERFFAIDAREADATIAGMDWLFDYAAEHEHDQATIWFAALQSIEHLGRAYDGNVIAALRNHRLLRHGGIHARVMTPRTRGAPRGPVLAYWPSDNALDELDGYQPPALCAVASSHERIKGWLDAWAPQNLLDPDASVESVSIRNPVVAVALGELTEEVNHNNGLSSPYERSFAILTLRALIDGGEQIKPEELRASAVREGWEPRHARALADLATDTLAGKRPRLPHGGFTRLPPDVLDRWRAAAKPRSTT